MGELRSRWFFWTAHHGAASRANEVREQVLYVKKLHEVVHLDIVVGWYTIQQQLACNRVHGSERERVCIMSKSTFPTYSHNCTRDRSHPVNSSIWLHSRRLYLYTILIAPNAVFVVYEAKCTRVLVGIHSCQPIYCELVRVYHDVYFLRVEPRLCVCETLIQKDSTSKFSVSIYYDLDFHFLKCRLDHPPTWTWLNGREVQYSYTYKI